MPVDVRLTPAQVAQLQKAKHDIEERHRLLDRAERAGLDVTAMRDELHQAEQLRQGLLAEFAPRPLRSE